MSIENAFETGRLYKPLRDLADAKRDTHSAFTLLPGLRGFWPMSAVNENGSAVDLSGHNQTLVATSVPAYNLTNSVPYVAFDGVDDYLSHSDVALYDILGTETYIDPSLRGLTIGGWFWFNSSSQQLFFGKWDGVGNQRSYLMQHTALSEIQFNVSNDGAALYGAISNTTALNTWLFCVGRLVPSTSTDVFINAAKTIGTVPGSIFNSSTQLIVGAGSGTFMDGRASLCFLCATALPDSVINNLFQVSRDLFGV